MAPLLLLGAVSLCGGEEVPNRGVLAPKMQKYVDDQTIAGAVMLVGDKDKFLDVECIGYADIAARKPMQPQAEFYIASMSKTMTAAALMMLVDEGKIGVDDPASKYLPEFKDMVVIDPKDPSRPPQPTERPITIRMLLSHASGLPKLAASEHLPLDTRPLKEAVALYAKTPLLFQPGTGYEYSNAGINTAAYIVEVVSGMPYEDFMQRRLFDPLGMHDTTFWPTAEQVSQVPTEYIETEDHQLRASPLAQLTYPLERKEGRYPVPAGGLFSTAQDIACFMQMLLNKGTFRGHRLLSEEAVHLMTTQQSPTKAYGFALSISPDGSFSHGGALQTNMGASPTTGIVRVFLTQLGAPYSAEERQLAKTFEEATLSLAPSHGTRVSSTPIERQ